MVFTAGSPWVGWTLFLADAFLTRNGYLEIKPGISPPDSLEMVPAEVVGH